MREITQEVCPKSTYQETHWLVPRAAGQLANGEQRRMMKCMICGLTEQELRDGPPGTPVSEREKRP